MLSHEKKIREEELLKSVRITLPHVPKDSNLQFHQFDNLKFFHIFGS